MTTKLLSAGLAPILFFAGCNSSNKSLEIKPVEFYARQLKNDSYVWEGPVANEDRIPSLHAARALAYIGDPGVDVLINSIEDPDIDVISIYDALREVGLPVDDFRDSIINNRSSSQIRNWWAENARSTKKERSAERKKIGLPGL